MGRLFGVCVLALVIALSACATPQHTKLTRGGDNDEGAGQLAQASMKLTTPDGQNEEGLADDDGSRARPRHYQPYEPAGLGYGGDMYGGDPYGGDPYGGNSYANWRMPQWNYATPNRTPHYQVSVGLQGSIEGSVTWNGPLPQKLASPCGAMDNPTLRVSTDKRLRGVVVYIEKVQTGRVTPYYTRPASVGGLVAKHGCALAPSAQIVAPLPAALQITGDADRAKIRIAPPKGAAKVQDLEEAGLIAVGVDEGITKVDSEDGKLGAAWVIGLESPYFAITDDLGHYRIDELAPGTYDVTFWQPPIAAVTHEGTWTYGAPIVVHRKVTVAGTKTAQLSVVMSAH